jgi:hypothetical protein
LLYGQLTSYLTEVVKEAEEKPDDQISAAVPEVTTSDQRVMELEKRVADTERQLQVLELEKRPIAEAEDLLAL